MTLKPFKDVSHLHEALDEYFFNIGSYIDDLNMGIQVGVWHPEFNFGLAYGRINRKWGLYIVYKDSQESVPINIAGLHPKSEGVELLIPLAHALTKEANMLIAELRKATKLANEMLEAINDSSNKENKETATK